MEKGVKLVVFNGEDFGYWENRTRNYLLSQGRVIWKIVQEAYVIPDTLNHMTQGELQRYENNYKALNLITTALGRNVYDRVAHLETAHDVWLKLCNTNEGSSKIKSSRRDIYNRQYQTFSQKPGESLDDCFARFESIVSSLCSYGALAYSDNEHAKELLYALDDSVWGMKITTLEESVDFATLDTEKLYSKLKSHELSRKGRTNHDASFSSKALITGACVGGHVANPINTTDSSALELLISSMRASPTMRSPYWRENSELCIGSARRGGDLLGAASSAATPPTSSPTAPIGRSSTHPPTSMTTPSGTTTVRAMIRRSTASGTRRRRRRSFRR
jgi:hypothetical protein